MPALAGDGAPCAPLVAWGGGPILFEASMLLLVGLVPVSRTMAFVTLGLLVVYLVPLLIFLFMTKRRVKK